MSVHSAYSGSDIYSMRFSIWIYIVVSLFVGCDFRKGTSVNHHIAQKEVTLTVFAAASLTDPFTEIAESFETLHPGVHVRLHFAGSQQLAQQLAHGAPADVFASANEPQMHVAIRSGRVQAEALNSFARNHLAVIIPHGNPASLKSLSDLARPNVLMVLADERVPVGNYSQVLLDNLSQTLGSSYKVDVLDNVVSYEQNVRAVLTKVTLGEADAGIVYASDIKNLKAVTSLHIPSHLNTEVNYLMAPLSDSQNHDLSSAFTQFVHSLQGKTILAKYGLVSDATT